MRTSNLVEVGTSSIQEEGGGSTATRTLVVVSQQARSTDAAGVQGAPATSICFGDFVLGDGRR